MERDRRLGCPDQKPKSQNNAYLKEQGSWQGESKERQPLPNVWDVLERKVRLRAKDVEDRPRQGSQEYKYEAEEVGQAQDAIDKRGTDRDRLILELYYGVTIPPRASLPVPCEIRRLSLEEFQQFRSQVEPLSDEELAEEVRKQEEEADRIAEEIHKREKGRLPGIARP
jgi:hypothetical protein